MSRAASSQRLIASCALATASAGVPPWAMQPGSSGTSTTKAASSRLQVTTSSYLWARSASQCQIVLEDGAPNLSHLVVLRVATVALQTEYLVNPRSAEDVVAAANPFRESERVQQCPQGVEPYRRVTMAVADLCEQGIEVGLPQA